MPIFEEGEKITPKEIKRQQRLLTNKIARLEWKKLLEEMDVAEAAPNGDCWLGEPADEKERTERENEA